MSFHLNGADLGSSALSRPKKTASRMRMVALAAVAALSIAACNQTDNVSRKANKPLSPQMLSLMSQKGMAPASPILVQIFKQESELEVWKQGADGRYALLKTYPICRWSGELGPKKKVGDRQAPEGFYNITPGQMNPRSSYYLSFNLGFPNAFDKAHGRTGDFLMVHGDCSSAGCYAMTDEQISEIFSLARESFAGGQRSFQVQAYPFRMTAQNMAKHRKNPNMPFWRNLKEGYDHFAVTRQVPKVNACGYKYVFNAEASFGQRFEADAPCPSYQVPPAIASAVASKTQRDNAQIAALSPSSPLAPVRTGRDGGMHPVFLEEIKRREGRSSAVAYAPAPGTIPDTVRPPGGGVDSADAQLSEVVSEEEVLVPLVTPPPSEAMRAAAPLQASEPDAGSVTMSPVPPPSAVQRDDGMTTGSF